MNNPLTPLRFKRRSLALYDKKTGVVCEGKRYSYSDYFRRCDRLSWTLKSLGVERGDCVAFLAFNCHRLLEAYYGVVQTGAVLLPLNVRLARLEYQFILNDSESKVLFYDAEFKETLGEIRPKLNSVKHLVPLDRAGCADWSSNLAYDDLLESATPQPFQEIEPGENDVAELFYTSGTTANPKGVMLTHRNLYLHALDTIIANGFRDTDIALHTIPLFHVNGWGAPQSVTCMGGTHVMLRKFDPEKVLGLIAGEKATCMSMVPTMANTLLNSPGLRTHDVSSMRLITLGGAAPSQSLVERLENAFGCDCHTGYGLTETSPVLTLSLIKENLLSASPQERLRRKAMTGIPIVGVEIRVVDEEGKDVARDGEEAGEIIARGDHVMMGYWKQPDDTARVIRNGWFHTGDMATIDGEGYILIVDRKKDIIISGGENIASIEIERCLSAHPSVYECAVIAVPDPKWGEVPKALVVLQPESPASEDEILEHCRNSLAPFKCPRSIEFLDSLPKGGTGKILKRRLRDQYWIGKDKKVQG